MAPKAGKLKLLDKVRKAKRDAERKRRAKIKADPQKYEEAKSKERERRQRRKEAKKTLLIEELSPLQQQIQREKWRERQRKRRETKNNREQTQRLLKTQLTKAEITVKDEPNPSSRNNSLSSQQRVSYPSPDSSCENSTGRHQFQEMEQTRLHTREKTLSKHVWELVHPSNSIMRYIKSRAMAPKAGKLKSLDKVRKAKGDAERKRRAKIKADPQKYQEAKSKARQIRQKRKDAKKTLLIEELSPRQQRIQREKWRERQRKSREAKNNKEQSQKLIITQSTNAEITVKDELDPSSKNNSPSSQQRVSYPSSASSCAKSIRRHQLQGLRQVNTTSQPGRPTTNKTKNRHSATVARKAAFQSSSDDDDHSVVDRNEETDSATDSEELSLYPNLLKKPTEPSTTAPTGSENLGKPDKDSDRGDDATCNNCSGDIIGSRYTCVQCPDYDLCGSCEAKGVHCLHYVLRIPASRPYAEIQCVLSKIRAQLLYGADSLPELGTPLDAPADEREEDAIKIEVKDELPDDPLKTEADALQPVDNFTEPETKYTAPETTEPTIPQISAHTTVTEIFDETLVIIENPVSASSAASHTAAAADRTKRKLAHKSTTPPYVSEKRVRVTHAPAQSSANLLIEVPGSKKLVYSVHERMLENIILYPQVTGAPAQVRGRPESSFQVYSHAGVKEPDGKPGPSTGMASTSSLSRSKKSDTINK